MIDSSSNRIGHYARLQIGIGLLLVLSIYLPSSGVILAKFSGGMYGPVFKQFSPAFFHLVNTTIKFGICAIIAGYLIKKLSIWERLEPAYASPVLFTIGNSIILLYLVIRIFASTIEGGGPALVVTLYGAIPMLIAKILLTIALIRVFIGLQPRSKPGSTIGISGTSRTGILITIAFTLVLYYALPVDLILRYLTMGWYNSLVRTSPGVFLIVMQFVKLLISYIIVRFITHKMSFWERLDTAYVNEKWLLGTCCILLFFLVLVFTPESIKRPVWTVLAPMGVVFLLQAVKAALLFFVFRLLLGITPRSSINATDNQSRKKQTQLENALDKAKRVLKNPVLLQDYMKKTGLTSNTIMDEIAAGKRKGFEYDGLVFVEDTN